MKDFFLFPVVCDISLISYILQTLLEFFEILLNAYFEFTCDYAKRYSHNNQLQEDT